MSKQAVVIIHGIGEQIPMDTLRGFVDTVWTSDEAIQHPHARPGVWSKPDDLSDSYELRRMTTSQNSNGVRTDFYEFYWAHMVEQTTYSQVTAWAKTLIFRPASSVPTGLKPLFRAVWTVIAVGLVLVAAFAILKLTNVLIVPAWVTNVIGFLGFVGSPLASFLLLKCAGDAARYLHVNPENIKCRHEIRKAGVDFIRKLHESDEDYSRIIVVGHSLGTVIGYDMLTHAWAQVHEDFEDTGRTTHPSLAILEAAAIDPKSTPDQVRTLQRDYLNALSAAGCRWRVTDFITMGSPLSHSEMLLAKNTANLRHKQEQREFPTSPPTLETTTVAGQDVQHFSFPSGRGFRVPHHAAVFAPTRWTNLYFPCPGIVQGDVIGGPIAGVMGRWVKDVPVTTTLNGGRFSHNNYWLRESQNNNVVDPHIQSLREAINLIDG